MLCICTGSYFMLLKVTISVIPDYIGHDNGQYLVWSRGSIGSLQLKWVEHHNISLKCCNTLWCSGTERRILVFWTESIFLLLDNAPIWYKRRSTLYNRNKRILWMDLVLIGLHNQWKTCKTVVMVPITLFSVFNGCLWVLLFCHDNSMDVIFEQSLFVWVSELIFRQLRNSKSVRTWN